MTPVCEISSAPSPPAPPRRRAASLRALYWQSVLTFSVVGAIAMIVIWLMRLAEPDYKPGVALVFTLIWILSSQVIIWLAYHRGVRDGRADAEGRADAKRKA